MLTDEVQGKIASWIGAQARASGLEPSVADDLASEVTLRLLVADARQTLERPFAYAATILKNLIRDRIRETQQAQRALEALVVLSPISVDPVDGTVDRDDLVSYLLDHAGLTKIQHEVVRLIYLDGLSVAEAAERLEKNPGTIHQHHARALEKLARAAAQRSQE